MSDQTAQPPQRFDGQGFPIPELTDVNGPTGLPIDNIPTGDEMTEAQINDALREAMRDEAGSFRPSVNAENAGDGTWLGRNAATPDPSDGNADGAGVQGESGVGAPAADASLPDGAGGGAGSPIAGTTTESAAAGAPAAPALPPGYILAPITEYNEFTGRSEIRYVPAPAEQIGNVLGWVNGIAPHERAQIAEWLEARRNGSTADLPLPPTHTSTASGGGPTPPGVSSVAPGGTGYQGAPIQPQGAPQGIDYSQLDPETAQALYIRDEQIAAVNQQLSQVGSMLQQQQAQQADFYARQAAEDRSRLQSSILSTTAAFMQERGFTPEQGEALSAAAAALQILPTMNAKHNGDIVAATRETLETAMWMTPEFRSAAIQNELADSLTTNASTEERKRKAAAIGAGGGAVPRVTPPSQPMTKAQREAAMVNDISQVMFNGSANSA